MTTHTSTTLHLEQELEKLRNELTASRTDTARAMARATRLSQVVAELGQHEDLDRTLRRVAGDVAELFSADICLVLEGPSRSTRVVASWGVPEHVVPTTEVALPAWLAELTSTWSFEGASPAHLPDWILELDPSHGVWVPLEGRRQRLGMLLIARCFDRPFEVSDEQELRAVGSRIALASENAWLVDETRRHLEQVHRLHGVTRSLSQHLTRGDAVEGICRCLVEELAIPTAALYLTDSLESTARLTASAGTDAPTWPTKLTDVPSDGVVSAPVGPLGDVTGRLVVPAPVDTDGLGVLTHIGDVAAIVLERASLHERTRHQARSDPLTGLPNRRTILEALTASNARATRTGGLLGLVFVDLDDFKAVNDHHGHSAGDEVLVETARRLRSVVRRGDEVGRLGGDEFVIVCEAADDEREVRVLAERLLAALRAPITLRTGTVAISASLGLTFSRGHRDPETLLGEADAAMYRAKRSSHERIVTLEPGDLQRRERPGPREAELRAAIDDERMVLHYQPIVDGASGELRAVEALLRLRGADGELIPPAAFLPTAESSGLIVELGAWVIRRACADLARWSRLEPGLTMAVNVSARQLLERDLVEVVAEALADHDLAPDRLTLEVTESMLIEGSESVSLNLLRLRELGVRFALDDFGTGYASLAYLKRLPLDVVKIDRSFTSGLGANPTDLSIVAAVLRLSRALGLRTVAEGVESLAQLEVLADLRCDLVQGFHIGRPGDASTVDDLLASKR